MLLGPERHFTSGCQLHRFAPLVKPGGSLSPCFSRRHYMPDTTNTKSDLEILTQLNADFLASVRNGDVRRFEQILAEDFMASLPDFLLSDKKQFLDMMAAPRPFGELKADEVRIRLLGDFAIIHAHMTFRTAEVYDVRDDTLMTGNGGMENGSAWPQTRFGSLDVLADVPHELSAQIGDGGENATGDDVALDPGEPQFDLIGPGRVSRREVQPDTIKRRAMGKMRAVQVAQGGGALELVEREMPEPTQGEVRVRVEACGVCHSDSLTVEGQWPGLSFPPIPGHEIAGIIDAVGTGVVGWSAGQRVGVGWFGGHCGRCEPCRRGSLIDCRNLRIPGISYDGGYADAMVAPANALAAIPDQISAVDAAPLLCAGVTTFNALRHSGAMPGDVVAVLGIGGLGHLGVQFANKLGFRTVAIAR